MSQPAIGPNCHICRHIHADYTCDAFPVEMPIEIVCGSPHTKSIKGDGGIMFEPLPPGRNQVKFDSVYPQEV